MKKDNLGGLSRKEAKMKRFNWLPIGLMMLGLTTVLLAGCVSKSDYEALQADYDALQQHNSSLSTQLQQVQSDLTDLQADYDMLSANYDKLKSELVEIESAFPNSGRVWTSDGSYIVDSGNKPIILVDYPLATNPTYNQLLAFLREDRTESHPYTGSIFAAIPCPPESWDVLEKLNEDYRIAKEGGREYKSPNVCSEYAEMLHNNAEKDGIRAGYVLGTNHAFNVFETTDKGLIYIDCTGFIWSFDGIDKLVTIASNGKITLEPLWSEDTLVYSDIYFLGDVYFEEIVWEGK